MLQLLITANVVPSSPILVTLMMEAIRSSETSVLTRATRRKIPEDGILRTILTYVRFVFFTAMTEECRLLGCYAVKSHTA
jgi:hypothetical protein